MGLVELFMVGVGLSMDAFAVAVCKGLGMKKVNWRHAFVIALMFGGFQALMPVAGWALGSQLSGLIERLIIGSRSACSPSPAARCSGMRFTTTKVASRAAATRTSSTCASSS